MPYLRGTVHALKTASSYYQGRVSFSCLFDEFGLDSPMNRVLRAAAATIASASALKPALRKRARNSLTRLAEAGELRPGDLYHGPERRSEHYAMALHLARHVLAATGRAAAEGPAPAWTFLIRTPELIEGAVRAILTQGLHELVEVSNSGIQLKPSKLSLNPDLVFGAIAVGDVKYSLFTQDWNRPHLYQAVAFATGYRVTRAGVFGFTSKGASPPQLQVGPVGLRAFAWLADETVAPEASAATLLDEVRDWINADASNRSRRI